MRFRDNARKYQQYMYQHMKQNNFCALFAEMGLGKTACALAVIDYFMYRDYSIGRTLVIAPKTVAESVWTDEAEKWEDFRHLKIVKIMGSEKERLAALREKADIYITNVDNVSWLVTHYLTDWPFDLTLVDELSCFKSADSKRFRNLRMVRPYMERFIGLTGTPAPNGLQDLWSQLYLIDLGERLGATERDYRHNYLYPEKVLQHGKIIWGITEQNSKRVYKQIEDVCMSMREVDYLKLPPLIFQDHRIKLPKAVMKKYDEFEKTLVLDWMEREGEEITAANAAVLTGKLLQFASGAVYDNDTLHKDYQIIHNHKLDTLEEILESANGQPVLIAYQFKHDLARMQKRFGGHVFDKTSADVAKWNNGEHSIMYLHPKSGGHGLNLQAGGCILVWFSMTWSLEQWLQLNKRLHRSGQKKPVIVHKLISMGTMDTKAANTLSKKEGWQTELLNATKDLFKKYKNAA